MTGVSFLLNVLTGKRLALLHEFIPNARIVGLLFNPDNPNAEADTRSALEAAQQFGQQSHVVYVRREDEFEAAFARLQERHVEALFVASDPLFVGRRERLVELAARHALPAIYDRREIAAAGGLVSYGTNFADAHRQAGIYAGRILRGAAASDLPVVQAAKFELIINLKTAKTLGLTISPTMLALADEVIE
jgi:putative ABC transport system substrate-binding protein